MESLISKHSHPQSNGQVECFVSRFKDAPDKSRDFREVLTYLSFYTKSSNDQQGLSNRSFTQEKNTNTFVWYQLLSLNGTDRWGSDSIDIMRYKDYYSLSVKKYLLWIIAAHILHGQLVESCKRNVMLFTKSQLTQKFQFVILTNEKQRDPA